MSIIVNREKAWERVQGEEEEETRKTNGKTHQHSTIGQSASLAHAFSVPVGRRNLQREVDYGHRPFRFLLTLTKMVITLQSDREYPPDDGWPRQHCPD